MENLRHLDLATNKLHGPIPEEIFEMTNLSYLYLANNPNFDKAPLPPSIANMTKLSELSLKNTNRNGSLPELVGFDSLYLLDLDGNSFTGKIPENYGKLPKLQYLLLNRNPISGRVPHSNSSRFLQIVLLDATNVTGDFSSICESPAIAGTVEIKGKEFVVADCMEEGNEIDCDCCHCCKVSGGCSDPYVTSLNFQWQKQFEGYEIDFGVNLTSLRAPFEPRETN